MTSSSSSRAAQLLHRVAFRFTRQRSSRPMQELPRLGEVSGPIHRLPATISSSPAALSAPALPPSFFSAPASSRPAFPLPLAATPLISRQEGCIRGRVLYCQDVPPANRSYSTSLLAVSHGASAAHRSSSPHGVISSALVVSHGAFPVVPSVPAAPADRRSFATKTKVKPYSSLKRRFKLLANGEYKRWKAGKRHNASTKTKKQRRQLRQPTVVPHGLKKPMRYLGFSR